MIYVGYFGPVDGKVYTIKYQKHGLPYMHLLIFLREDYKIYTVEHMDTFISAQISDPDQHPQLYAMVTKYMLHNPYEPI